MMNPEELEDEIGGVQGSDDDAADDVQDGSADRTECGTAVQSSDAGEIEWAGGLVKKAPGAPQP